MRVAIRVDAGPVIGGGHAMRCLTLADALAARGAEVTFVTAAMPESLETRIRSSAHRLERIPCSPEMNRTGADWHEPPLTEKAQADDVENSGRKAGAVDWLIVDHYLLDARWHTAARSFARNVLVVDDLANRSYDCDILVDQTFRRAASDYSMLVPERATVLTGALYALLRPEFEEHRADALNRRKETSAMARILLSMGTADIGGSTTGILLEVLAAAPNCEIDVVLGSEAPSLKKVRELARNTPAIHLHVETDSMAQLMRDADLAIGAAGTTSWERCCLGLPAIALVLAENQRPSATALADAGAVLAVDGIEEIGPALGQLLDNTDHLEQMSAAAFAITDGQGTRRVVLALLGEDGTKTGELQLRAATFADAEMLWLWRNEPETRAQSRNKDAISWSSHVRWLATALSDDRREILVGEKADIPVGTVGFHPTAGGTEVSITVAPERRGTGIGLAMLAAACEQRPSLEIYASVRDGNEASRRLFESSGFDAIEGSEAGFVRYLRKREGPTRKQA